jgi:hypothetical protein
MLSSTRPSRSGGLALCWAGAGAKTGADASAAATGATTPGARADARLRFTSTEKGLIGRRTTCSRKNYESTAYDEDRPKMSWNKHKLCRPKDFSTRTLLSPLRQFQKKRWQLTICVREFIALSQRRYKICSGAFLA